MAYVVPNSYLIRLHFIKLLHCFLEHNLVVVSSIVGEPVAVSYGVVAVSMSVSMSMVVVAVVGVVNHWHVVHYGLHVLDDWLHDRNGFHHRNDVVVGSVLVLVRSGDRNLNKKLTRTPGWQNLCL